MKIGMKPQTVYQTYPCLLLSSFPCCNKKFPRHHHRLATSLCTTNNRMQTAAPECVEYIMLQSHFSSSIDGFTTKQMHSGTSYNASFSSFLRVKSEHDLSKQFSGDVSIKICITLKGVISPPKETFKMNWHVPLFWHAIFTSWYGVNSRLCLKSILETFKAVKTDILGVMLHPVQFLHHVKERLFCELLPWRKGKMAGWSFGA